MNQRSTLSQQPKQPSFFTPITERFSYDRLKRLGGGTYGTVYLGRDTEGGAVAVKVIQRSNLYRLKWEGTELVEVSMLRRLSGQHPNMLRFLACVGSRLTSEVFIFTELCEKGALTKLITRLTELETFLLFKQLVEGMDFLHQQNIMHHDLKPDNLLVTAKNQLKIADFGSARWSDALLKSLPKYTPFYASPEVFLSENFDKKCDVFSAGYILYQMLAGERLNKQVKNIGSFFEKYRTTGFKISHPAISPRWAEVIRNMLNFDPEQRPSFSQLRLVMRDFQAPLDRLPPSRSPSAIESDLSSRYLQSIMQHVRGMEAHNNYLVSILCVFKQFETEKSMLIPRIYKIILLYLSLSLYCLLSEDTLSQLDHKSALVINGQSVQEMEESLTVEDRAVLGTVLREARGRVNVGKEQMKDYLRRKVVEDIKEGNSQSESMVLQELQISEGVRQLEQGEPGVTHFYRERITRCVNNLYHTAEELQALGNADLACYLTLLCVSQVALDSAQSSTLPPLLSTILQFSRNQLLAQISTRKPR